jgi:hypothetical protein
LIKALHSVYNSARVSIFGDSASIFLSTLFIVVLMWFGTMLVLDQGLTPGELLRGISEYRRDHRRARRHPSGRRRICRPDRRCRACLRGSGMIFPSNRVRIMVATKPVDFRKGHDGLAALVKNELHKDPFTGTVFVFRSRKADRLKLIYWDGGGLVMAYNDQRSYYTSFLAS